MKTKEKQLGTDGSQTAQEGRSYVYIYTDPQDDKPFYVGKGVGDRARAHLKNPSNEKIKAKIAEIRRRKEEPRIEILCGKLTAQRALVAEAAVIELLGKDNLGNRVSGHTKGYGRMPFDEYQARIAAKRVKVAREHKAVMVNLNKKFREEMRRKDKTTTEELYKIARGSWRIGKRAKEAKYAIAVYRGIVVEVYKGEWRDVPENMPNAKGRKELHGEVAEEIRGQYVGRFVGTGAKGARNPVYYSWAVPKKTRAKRRGAKS